MQPTSLYRGRNQKGQKVTKATLKYLYSDFRDAQVNSAFQRFLPPAYINGILW